MQSSTQLQSIVQRFKSYAPVSMGGVATPQKPTLPASAGDSPVELYTWPYYRLCAVGGLLSCGITHTAITPLDLVKCRLQASPGLYKGVFDGFRGVAKSDGLVGLTRGWAPTAIGYSMQGICKFGFYEFFKRQYAEAVGEDAWKYKDLLYLSASASAELIADVALVPMESVKVRMQTGSLMGPDGKPVLDAHGVPKPYASTMREALPKMIKEEGFGTLYKSLVPLWMRQVPYTMMKFWAFERTVETIYKHVVPKPRSECTKGEQLMVTFASGYIAGVFCAIVSHPADTVVSKLNNSPGSTAGSILKELGFNGMWRGLVARIVMIGTLTGLQWWIFDAYKVFNNVPPSQPLSKPE